MKNNKKTYYTDWLKELEWLITAINNAACTFTAMPEARNNSNWVSIIKSNRHDLERAMNDKLTGSDDVYNLRISHINKMLKELKELNVPWYVKDDLVFFMSSYKEFMRT